MFNRKLQGTLLRFGILNALLCNAFATFEKEIQEEFCQWDMFNISCSQNQFILMHSAHYGRMKVGRCIPIEYETGCKIDVMIQLEERCSGRQQCSMAISDTEIFRVQPCRKDLVPYLEVSYKCVDVSGQFESPSSLTCDGVIPVKDTSGYLSSHMTANRGVGSERCPWLIEARSGQHLAITMKSFAQRTPDRPTSAGSMWSAPPAADLDCVRVAEVRETLVSSTAHYLQLCPGDSRKSTTYVSTSNSIQLNFVDNRFADHMFLIHYEVVGCPDVVAPQNAWLTRNGDNLVVICNYTTERWYIACSGREWASQLSNCSAGANFPGIFVDNEQITRNGGSFPFGLLMAVAAGAIIGISIGFGCLLVLCIGRKRWKDRRHVQNVENSNRENVYKLIDLWAKPEMHCDCAMLQPEVTCECVLPDVHHLHRDVAIENLIRYVNSADDQRPPTATRQESNRCSKRFLQGGSDATTHQWDTPDRGDDPSGSSQYDQTLFHQHGKALQRCTCSSGKCRHHHHFVSGIVEEMFGSEEQCSNADDNADGNTSNQLSQQLNSAATKSEIRTPISCPSTNSTQQKTTEQQQQQPTTDS